MPEDRLHYAEKVSRRGGKTGEDLVQRASPEMVGDDLRKDGAEVGGESEIAALIQLLLLETGPTAMDAASFDTTADNEQRAGVAVVGAAVAVLAGHAAELGHRHDHDVVHAITEVGDKRGDRSGEIVETLRELARR